MDAFVVKFSHAFINMILNKHVSQSARSSGRVNQVGMSQDVWMCVRGHQLI